MDIYLYMIKYLDDPGVDGYNFSSKFQKENNR